MPDLMTMLIGIGKVIPTFIMLTQALAITCGVWFFVVGGIEVWGSTNENMVKNLSGGQSYSTVAGLFQCFIGVLLLSLGTLELMGMLSRTITGDYAAARMTADSLSYSPSSESSLKEKNVAVVMALLALMQAVGIVAVFKGLIGFNRRFKHQSSESFGKCACWSVAGALAWNLKWFSDVVNNTIGYDFISIFTSLS